MRLINFYINLFMTMIIFELENNLYFDKNAINALNQILDKDK